MTKTLLLISLTLAACSSVQQSRTLNSKDSTVRKTSDQQALQLKSRVEREQELRDRNMVLAKQSQMNSAQSRQTLNELPTQSRRPTEVIPGTILDTAYGKMSEGQLYAEIVDRYQAHDTLGFDLRSKAYLSRFRASDRRDDIIYLKGLSELGEKNYGVALAQFNRILRDHPNGKKAASATFAKGITYQRMNLAREAKLALTEVLQRYPGSPESLRAKAELKILK